MSEKVNKTYKPEQLTEAINSKSIRPFWYGTPRETKYEAEVVANKYIIYRIHVRLK